MNDRPKSKPRGVLGTLGALVLVALVALLRQLGGESTSGSGGDPIRETSDTAVEERSETAVTPAPSKAAPPAARAARDDAALVLASFRAGRSGVAVEFPARVQRLLPDDEDGHRHQKFLIRLSNDHTLLVAHNIDLAPRVPVRAGDEVRIHGQFEHNDKGGVVHWTHHDPRGSHEPGWIEHGGERYE